MVKTIEETVLGYLTEKLLPIKVHTEVPETPPESFITIEKTGRTQKHTLNREILAIRSYGPSLLKAAELSERVIENMLNITELINISKVELISEHNNTDIRKKQYRYQAVVAITHYN